LIPSDQADDVQELNWHMLGGLNGLWKRRLTDAMVTKGEWKKLGAKTEVMKVMNLILTTIMKNLDRDNL
jgi:hypothetical protein